MEATPLLRFVCATFAMRCGWEGNAGNAHRSVGAVAGRSVGRAVPANVPRSVDAKCEDSMCSSASAMFSPSPVAVDEEQGGVVGHWMVALENAMAAHTDEEAATIVGSVCKEASSAGAFADLVAMLITTVLDMDDTTSEGRQQGISEVILRMCFARTTNTANFGEGDIVATPYCDIVLKQLVETMRSLLELVDEDEVWSHTGGRLLDRTLRVINDNLQARVDEGGDLVL